ncbi:methyl-accepting chemotaxis protein [Oryzomonas japonica]|uniref:Methyl-accepting chemotaxis protein n=1 Tax=Oryzomonas japonica TaxID=2603858 RepID=A0A7J4ZNY5_9BACT|nr:HAMP domain-containing methyl-accepting chemotaxis protein [Oryzomonas japonica]KAB0664528.1 methyl-accepting chemotaxis protein [Oryzomonas japonica]
MTVAKKLLFLMVGSLAVLVFVAALSWSTAGFIEGSYDEMFRSDYRQVQLSTDSLDRMGMAMRAYKNYLIRGNAKHVGEFRKETGAIEDNLKEFIKLSDEDDRKAAEQALQLLAGYRASMDKLVGLREANTNATEVDTQLGHGFDMEVRKALVTLAETNKKAMETTRETVRARAQQRVYVQMACAFGAAVVLLVFSTLLGRGIRKSIADFSAAIDRVADNDLTVQVNVENRDEFGQMGIRLNAMLDSLRRIIQSMNESALQVSAASSQLSASSVRIATGAEEVAAQANAVATASEEMAATSGEIAQNCGRVADGARQASDSARDGAEVVESTITGMSRISDKVSESARTVEALGKRSDQIGAIVSTIEDIADQTNLLALNAAIEAARAGEQGRGFAVVADEVRALAERTTKATREIGEMIKAIQAETRGAVAIMEEGVHEVERGSEGAGRSGQALLDILGKVSEVAMEVNQIATAAEQQTATTHEITSNIQQMSQVVDDTAHGAQESAQAASDLARLAATLQEEVRRFRLA